MFSVQIAGWNPTPFQGQHVGPMGFLRVRAKIPEVETVADARKSIDFLVRQVHHHVVRIVLVLRRVRGRPHPIATSLRITGRFLEPIPADRALPVNGT